MFSDIDGSDTAAAAVYWSPSEDALRFAIPPTAYGIKKSDSIEEGTAGAKSGAVLEPGREKLDP
jgi:hypothetical protein